MSFSDELDLMSEDTQSLLASETLTFERVRPTGDLDADTFERTETVDDFTVDAVPGEPVVTADEQTGRRVTLNTWIVRAGDCDFRPSPQGYFTASGSRWRIVRVADQQVGREYLITAQRIA